MAKITLFGLAFLCVSFFGSAAEAGQGRAGLWEVSTKMDMGVAMPAMSAEQQAMMKQMGVQIPSAGGSTTTTKRCLTPEQAESDTLAPPGDADDGCTTSSPVVEGSTVTVRVTCAGELKGTGTATVTYANDSAYSGTFAMKGTADGHPIDMKSEFRGTWLGADCGSVKPIAQ